MHWIIRLSKDLPITATQEAFRERHPIPPGWGPLPHQQEGDGFLEGEEDRSDGLARGTRPTSTLFRFGWSIMKKKT
jgi:hypothetical protein